MRNQTRQITCSALMCSLIIVSTLWFKFTVPGTDVLFTTQVFFVLLCGHLLPPRYCLLSIGAYLLLGLVGIPVFSSTQGLGVIATPSFGYLLAFPFAAITVSAVRKKLSAIKGTHLVASLCGILVMYMIALAYIAALNNLYFAAPISPVALLASYCFAFLPMDIAKGVLAAMVAPRLEKALHTTSLQ